MFCGPGGYHSFLTDTSLVLLLNTASHGYPLNLFRMDRDAGHRDAAEGSFILLAVVLVLPEAPC